MQCGSVTRFEVLNSSKENSQPVVSVSILRGDPSASQYPALENSTADAENAATAAAPSTRNAAANNPCPAFAIGLFMLPWI